MLFSLCSKQLSLLLEDFQLLSLRIHSSAGDQDDTSADDKDRTDYVEDCGTDTTSGRKLSACLVLDGNNKCTRIITSTFNKINIYNRVIGAFSCPSGFLCSCNYIRFFRQFAGKSKLNVFDSVISGKNTSLGKCIGSCTKLCEINYCIIIGIFSCNTSSFYCVRFSCSRCLCYEFIFCRCACIICIVRLNDDIACFRTVSSFNIRAIALATNNSNRNTSCNCCSNLVTTNFYPACASSCFLDSCCRCRSSCCISTVIQ